MHGGVIDDGGHPAVYGTPHLSVTVHTQPGDQSLLGRVAVASEKFYNVPAGANVGSGSLPVDNIRIGRYSRPCKGFSATRYAILGIATVI
jgi:hypothetical protein